MLLSRRAPSGMEKKEKIAGILFFGTERERSSCLAALSLAYLMAYDDRKAKGKKDRKKEIEKKDRERRERKAYGKLELVSGGF